MRIVVVSDLHLDHVTSGVSRFDDVAVAVTMASDFARRGKADAFVCLGDVMDPDSGAKVFRCIHFLLEIAVLLHTDGVPSYWLAGNHDVIEDGGGRTTLEPLRAIAGATVVDRPGKVCIPNRKGGQGLLAAAFPFASLKTHYEPSEAFVDAPLVFSHLNVAGIQPGEESGEMARGRDVALPLSRLRGKTVLQGHYHRAQRQEIEGVDVRVVGSIQRLTHGEEIHRPNFLAVEV